MNPRPRIGLLPLYLKLYDEAQPQARAKFEPFLKTVARGFERRGVDVCLAPVCRLRQEFRRAVRLFEKGGADLIVTLHLAYSPSLESTEALRATALPVLMLDTTMDHDFGRRADPSCIMFNHGIHGVQDLASVLRRCGKPFQIVAGHVARSNVLDRAAGIAAAARGARVLRSTRALRIGPSFEGMGDFAVPERLMGDALGIEVRQIDTRALAADVRKVTPREINAEVRRDRRAFAVRAPDDVHRRSVRVGLGLRRRLERDGCTAFSMNFLAFDSGDGPVDTVPFLEASKAMARGVGYAGEGDVLTAALVGALCAAFGRTTFAEIFCPDWKGGSLFLSHMGEINPEVAATKPLLCEKPFPYTPARNPAILACAPAPGRAVLVNLAPGPRRTFSLIVASVEVLPEAGRSRMPASVRGWIRPACGVGAFLEAYSRLGGTHHSALVLGDRAEAIAAFAAFAGIECSLI